MLTSWEIALLGLGVLGPLAALGARLWFPNRKAELAKAHMGVGIATGAIVALAVFILDGLNACSAASLEHRRQIEFLIAQKGKALSGIDLKNAQLDGAYLRMRTLTGADLHAASLERARLDGADLTDADLTYADLDSARLDGAKLRHAALGRASLRNANLDGARLPRAGLQSADLRGAKLAGAVLVNADLEGAHLENADLTAANLAFANLTGAHLKGATLDFAHLNGAVLSGTHFNGFSSNDLDRAQVGLALAVYDATTDWPYDCSGEDECFFKPNDSPAMQAISALGGPARVKARMDSFRALLDEVKPKGWQLRYTDRFGIELESASADSGQSARQLPVATFRLELQAYPLTFKPQGLYSDYGALYCEQLDSFVERDAGNLDDRVPTSSGGLAKPGNGFMREYEYVADDGPHHAFDVYYSERKFVFRFVGEVREDSYFSYRLDFLRFFSKLGASPAFPRLKKHVHGTQYRPYTCKTKGS